MAAPSGDDGRVQRARHALTAPPAQSLPELASRSAHWWDRDLLRELLIQAACPTVCVGHRQADGPDWHAWCEQKADAALSTLEAIRPPEPEFNPNWTTHPCTTLTEAMQERGITTEQLAADCGITPWDLSRILAGEALYPVELAVKFAEVFGASPQFWWRLRTNYELDLALGRTDTDREDRPAP